MVETEAWLAGFEDSVAYEAQVPVSGEVIGTVVISQFVKSSADDELEVG